MTEEQKVTVVPEVLIAEPVVEPAQTAAPTYETVVNEIPADDFEKAKVLIEDRMEDAKKLMDDPAELERFLQRLEKKFKEMAPPVGDVLARIPLMISMVRSWIKGEYKDFPIGVVIAGLLYFFSPIDLIPDIIPVLGYGDDVVVVAVCLKMIDSDLKEYSAWREANGKVLI